MKTNFLMLLLIFRCVFSMYAPKPEKFGIKFWMFCDATTYFVLRAFPYVDKEKDRALTGLGKFVTLSLLEPCRNAGLILICDNFLQPCLLQKKLLKQNTTSMGTIRGHRGEISNKIQH